MTIRENLSGDEIQQSHQNVDELAQLSEPNNSRRSFSKAGLVASGVLLTLGSRPVLGELVCKTPSGFESGNLSFHGTPITCAGRLPSYYINQTDWPAPYVADTTGRTFATGTGSTAAYILGTATHTPGTAARTPGTKFADVFSCSGNGKRFVSLTMTDVLKGEDQLGAHCVAALLNARSGLTPVLTEAQVKNIFNEFDLKGYFEPTIGIQWYPADIVAYLKTTMS